MSFKNKEKILTAISAGLTFLGFLFILPSAYAEENLQSALKEVAEKVGAIEDIKNDSYLNNQERKVAELLARKDALLKIFDLTLLEDKDLNKKLLEIKNLDENQKKIRDGLINSLKENENAYSEMKNRIEETDSVTEVKQLAIDFKNWRNLVYNPKVEKIISFNLVFQSKNIIAVAQNRANKIREELKKINSEDLIWIESLLEKAELKIKKAENLNITAENLIIQEITKGENLSFFKKFFYKNQIPAIKSLIEESTRNLKDAYLIFIEIGRAAKESSK